MKKRVAASGSNSHASSSSSVKRQEAPSRIRSSSNGSRFFILGVLVGSALLWRLFKIPLLLAIPQQRVITNNTVKTKRSTSHNNVWLAGIVRDASTDIQPHILQYLVDLNCNHDIHIHILATTGVEACLKARGKLLLDDSSTCGGEFHVVQEPRRHDDKDNRIDRIAQARDYQRSLLQKEVANHDAIIMIADLDLYSLPSIQTLQQQIHVMQHTLWDAVCAAGIMYRPFGYYDTFATILQDGTFVYPLRGRFSQRLYKGEDSTKIRSNDLYGNYTQWDLLEYFATESKRLSKTAPQQQTIDSSSRLAATPVPVQSCFGGLALYKANAWLEPNCTYHGGVHDNDDTNNTTTPSFMMRYATKSSQRPCEHVVLHQCLHKQRPNFKIAVQPFLRTEWNDNKTTTSFEKNRLRPGSRHETLGVFKKHIKEGDSIVNGEFVLRINEKGMLVVEKRRRLDKANSVMWSTKPNMLGNNMDYWTHSFLMLRTSGVLELVQQVSKSNMEERHDYTEICQKATRCECDVKSDHCKVLVWTTAKSKRSDGQDDEPSKNETLYVLVLDENGTLRVVDEKSNVTVWKNTGEEHKDSVVEK